MTVTINGSFDMVQWVLDAQNGYNLNNGISTDGYGSYLIANTPTGFMVTAVWIEDETVGEATDDIFFRGAETGNSLATTYFLGTSITSLDDYYDDYRFSGLWLTGSSGTITEAAFGNISFYESREDFAAFDHTFEGLPDVFGDSYAANLPESDISIRGLNWSADAFALAAIQARAGDLAALQALLSQDDYVARGTDADDTIITWGKNDTLTGGGGANYLNGGGGNDTYILGDGDDWIEDGDGWDTIKLTHGSSLNWVQNVFTGDAVRDAFRAADFDNFVGSDEADSFIMPVGRGLRVDLHGGGGGDVLAGAKGRDQIWGDGGSDLLRGNGGNDTLDGGANADTAYFDDHYGSVSKGWTINLSKGSATTLSDSRLGSPLAFVTETDTLRSIENVYASAGDDLIVGNTSNNLIDGLGGNDTVSFADHVGTFQNGWDIDMAAGKATTLNTGRGTALFTTETDTFFHVENIIGSTGNDTIKGSADSNFIRGGAGNDVIIGGTGEDVMIGGVGNERFRYNSVSEGGDRINGFVSGSDKLVFLGSAFGNLDPGQLKAGNFVANASGAAAQADDHFIFRTTDKTLWFDSDGNGAGAAVMIADLSDSASLSNTDILIL